LLTLNWLFFSVGRFFARAVLQILHWLDRAEVTGQFGVTLVGS